MKSAQQAASTDEKHVQYIFCTLGTPRALGYTDWGELPLAESLGSHIKVSSCDMMCVYVLYCTLMSYLYNLYNRDREVGRIQRRKEQ